MATELSTNEKLARLGAFIVARAAFETPLDVLTGDVDRSGRLTLP